MVLADGKVHNLLDTQWYPRQAAPFPAISIDRAVVDLRQDRRLILRLEMALIRPRLTDYHGIMLPQAELDFAIPLFDEDIPLYVDPFLLWRSPSQQDNALHTSLINAFNHLGYLRGKGQEQQAINTLIAASECDEVGLGSSETRKGKRIGEDKAREIIAIFDLIPSYAQSGFRHFEEIQFFCRRNLEGSNQ